MATTRILTPPCPQLSATTTPFPFPRVSFPLKPKPKPKLYLSFTTRATTDDDPEPESSLSEPDSDSDPFESRLSNVRLRYRSGTGKKAEVRKSKKGISGSKSGSGSGIYLPPVPLKEAVSDGVKVEFGFSRFSERINGRIAILGLTALMLVELATGKGVISYHTPAVVLIQVYFVAAVSALYIKYEKEKVSVWPQSSPSPSNANE